MDTFIGAIQLFPYTFAPQGWAYCEGQLMQIMQYQALYSLIGNMFGGDGTQTFALPDLKGKEPMPNMRYCIALEGIYPMRP